MMEVREVEATLGITGKDREGREGKWSESESGRRRRSFAKGKRKE